MSVALRNEEIRLSFLRDMEGRFTQKRTFVIADQQHPFPDLEDHRPVFIGSIEVEDDYVGTKMLHIFEYVFEWTGSEEEGRAMDAARGY